MASSSRRKFFLRIHLIVLCGISFIFPALALSQENKTSLPPPVVRTLTVERATMCEEVAGQDPKNPAAVFSIKRQIVYCFSSFDSIVQKTYIHHSWYRGEKLITKIKLLLHPPRWATISRIQLREADRGPWRVEITDQDDNVLKILRFSVTN
jgi:hypothetical protein